MEPVYNILEKVKKITGKNVEFIEKSDIGSYAKVKIARKNMPSHIIYYVPEYSEQINHLIAHECGHIIRIFEAPEEKRILPFTNDELKRKALKQIEGEILELSKNINENQLIELVNYLYSGLISQLTNQPPDIMIEKWIYDAHPTLRQIQKIVIEKQRDESIQALKPEVCLISPRTIYDASNIMNYVFFRLLGFHFKQNYIMPYNNTPYLDKGKELASITQIEYNNSCEGDIKMINRWAEYLGVKGWFEWTNFENT